MGVLLTLAGAACTQAPEHPPVFPVTGKVLYEGKPAPGAVVILHTPGVTNDASRPRGQADANGEFHLTTYEAGDGAPAGDYVVTVEWRQAGDHPEEGAELLPPVYGDPKLSPLKTTVTSEGNAAWILPLKARP